MLLALFSIWGLHYLSDKWVSSVQMIGENQQQQSVLTLQSAL